MRRRAGALLALAVLAPARAAEPSRPRESLRREALFLRASEPLSRESVEGWLAGDFHRYEPARRAYLKENILLIGEPDASGAFKLVFAAWPMGREGRRAAGAPRLEEIRRSLPGLAARFSAPRLSPREIVFEGGGLVCTLRSLGDDLVMKVERAGGRDARPGYALLTELLAPAP